MSFEEFYQKIEALPKSFKNRNLKEYLLALYSLIDQNFDKIQTPTFEILYEIIEKAFSELPKNIKEDKFPIIKPPESIFDFRIRNLDEVRQYIFSMIEFLVSDLQFMEKKGKQMENSMQYFGLQSQTSNVWYNFDTFSYLECGTRCMLDSSESHEIYDVQPSWQLLGQIIDSGRVYE